LKKPEFCVFELGTNARGEIKNDRDHTTPMHALITNINPSHLGGLRHWRGILEEKLDLFYLTKEGGQNYCQCRTIPISCHVAKMVKKIAYPLPYSMMSDASFNLNVDKNLGWGREPRIAISFLTIFSSRGPLCLEGTFCTTYCPASSLAYSGRYKTKKRIGMR